MQKEQVKIFLPLQVCYEYSLKNRVKQGKYRSKITLSLKNEVMRDRILLMYQCIEGSIEGLSCRKRMNPYCNEVRGNFRFSDYEFI